MDRLSPPFLALRARIAEDRTIRAAHHEGIGNALRAAFDQGSYGLPDEMAKLLRKLDR